MNYLSNRVISSPVRPVTEQIPPPSRVQKSLDILADTLVKLKDELTQVKTEIAVLKEDRGLMAKLVELCSE